MRSSEVIGSAAASRGRRGRRAGRGRAQYTAPPPDPGSRTSSTARPPGPTPRSTSGSSPPARSTSRARSPRAARGRPRWTPSRARSRSTPRRSAATGIRSSRSATPCCGSSTRCRTPRVHAQRRHHDPLARDPLLVPGATGQPARARHRRRARPEADRLQLRRLPRRAADLRPDDARGLDELHLGGRPGPFPPASGSVDPPHTYTGPYCARNGMTNQINSTATPPSSTTTATPATSSTGRRSCAAMRCRSTSR